MCVHNVFTRLCASAIACHVMLVHACAPPLVTSGSPRDVDHVNCIYDVLEVRLAVSHASNAGFQ
jgi:hypothetical protein